MDRILIALLVLGRVAAAGDTLTVDGNALFGWIGPMAGGSLHYEHTFDPDQGITLRAQAERGTFLDGGDFDAVFALVGYRHHWGALYLELEAGYFGMRHERAVGDFGETLGVQWFHLPDGQITFGGRIGAIDLGVWTNIPAAGLGVHLGVAI